MKITATEARTRQCQKSHFSILNFQSLINYVCMIIPHLGKSAVKEAKGSGWSQISAVQQSTNLKRSADCRTRRKILQAHWQSFPSDQSPSQLKDTGSERKGELEHKVFHYQIPKNILKHHIIHTYPQYEPFCRTNRSKTCVTITIRTCDLRCSRCLSHPLRRFHNK